jgi:hypothetical protein
MELLNTRDTPPTGWVYVERATGTHFERNSYDQLVAAVVAHREYRGLPVHEAERDIQDQICLTLGEPTCRRAATDPAPIRDRTRGLDVDTLMSANRALFGWLGTGGATVAPSVSQDRAKVCLSCPLNKPVSKCSCSPFYKVLQTTIPKERVIDGLQVCMACGCSLKAKVLLTDEVIKGSSRNADFPAWCWQRAIVHNP